MASRTSDYIPRPDGNFDGFVLHFWDSIDAWWSAQGLDPDDLTPLRKALDVWIAAYPAHTSAQAAVEAAAAAKKLARSGLEAQLRPIAAFVQTYPKTTNMDRADMGLTVRDTHTTPTSTPTTRPLVRIAMGQRLQHQLRFVDEATPTRRAKPKGVVGVEVWLALVGVTDPPPPLGTAYRYVDLASDGSARAEFTSIDAGKQACYAARWRSSRGDVGPWSEVCSATVAA